jgi:three-Cys-motif partner protein
MKNKWANRVFLDLFSGPGRCRVRPQGDFEDGSPLIALSNPFTHYFFVDISSYCTDALQKRISNSNLPTDKKQRIITDDANICIDEVMSSIESIGPETLGFAFIDPPGIQLHFETLRKLSLNTRIDLLINFPLGMNIKRQLSYQLQKDPSAGESAFDRYFGTPDWRNLCDESNNGTIGFRLLKLYENQLQGLGYAYVGDERAVKNRGRSLYMLVFASKNPKGKEFWEKVTQVAPSGQRRLL